MKEYHIIITYPPLTPEIKKMGMSIGETFRKNAHRNNLTNLARKITETVLKKHGGEFTYDGSGYGLKGNPKERVDMLSLKTNLAGVEALKEIEGIGRISESIDFNKLSKVPAGMTNIPPGLCWSRPKPKL